MVINVTRKARAELLQKFKCSDSFLSMSLSCQRHSLLSRRIRLEALNKFGGLLLSYE